MALFYSKNSTYVSQFGDDRLSHFDYHLIIDYHLATPKFKFRFYIYFSR